MRRPHPPTPAPAVAGEGEPPSNSGSGGATEGPRVGVFGGTFDPVHVGHLIVAADLSQALRLDRLLFVPAGRPPHKPADLVSTDTDRLAMLELALADDPLTEISPVDLERVGPSYTVDLLAILQAQLPTARLVFLMGEDSLRDLPTWRQPEEIARLAELGVAARPGVTFDLEAVFARVPTARGRVAVVETVQLSISSSDIRRRVRLGAPIRHQVPRSVEIYIAERGLYR